MVLRKFNSPLTCGEVAIYLSTGTSQQIPNWSYQTPTAGAFSPSGLVGGPSSGYPHHQTSTSPFQNLTPDRATEPAGQNYNTGENNLTDPQCQQIESNVPGAIREAVGVLNEPVGEAVPGETER